MAAEMRRCGVCQLMKSDGICSDDGRGFICDGCDEDAAKFLEIVGNLGTPPPQGFVPG
jgi:hypothetical protein